MDKMFLDLKKMVCEDMREVIAKGSLEPCDYKPIGEAIDIYKDVMEIQKMEMELGMDESNEMWEEPLMSGVPARSPRTGRFVSRTGGYEPMYNSYGDWEAYGSTAPGVHGTARMSYHDADGSIKKDLEELLRTNKSDHERMLIMRVMEKLDSNK